MIGYEVDIVYIATKAHAKKLYLIPPLVLKRDIAASKNLEELTSYLHLTYYRDELMALGKVSLGELIKVFKKVFCERVKSFVDLLPRKFRRFMEQYLMLFDIEGVIEILAEKMGGRKHREIEYYAYPFSRVDFEYLLSEGDLESSVLALMGPPLYLSRETVDMWTKYRSLYIIELGLLREYYIRLLEILNKMPSDEAEALREIIGVEVDTANISIIVGPMLYGYSPEIALKMLIPYTYKVSLSSLKEAYGLEAKVLTKLVPEEYRDVVENLLAGNDVLAKCLTYRLILRRIKSILPRYPVSFAFVFGVIKLFEFEYRNLRLIAECIEGGLSPAEISSLLIVDEP